MTTTAPIQPLKPEPIELRPFRPSEAFDADSIQSAEPNLFNGVVSIPIVKLTPLTARQAVQSLEIASTLDLSKADDRSQLLQALHSIQQLASEALHALGAETVDALFRRLAALFETLPPVAWAVDLAAAAVATLGVHLDWRNGGAQTLEALAPSTLNDFIELARFVDSESPSYAARREAATGATKSALPSLVGEEAEAGGLSLGQAIDMLIRQTRKIAGSDLDGAAAASEPSAVRDLVMATVRYAESRKQAALDRLANGDDLSQAAILELQEELQTVNQIISAMSQILNKEGDIAEQIIRNIG